MSELIHFFTPYAQEHVSEMHDTDLTYVYSILYPLEGVTFSVKITCKFFMFLSVWEKIMPCVYTYAYMDQKGVCCNMKTCVVFI